MTNDDPRTPEQKSADESALRAFEAGTFLAVPPEVTAAAVASLIERRAASRAANGDEIRQTAKTAEDVAAVVVEDCDDVIRVQVAREDAWSVIRAAAELVEAREGVTLSMKINALALMGVATRRGAGEFDERTKEEAGKAIFAIVRECERTSSGELQLRGATTAAHLLLDAGAPADAVAAGSALIEALSRYSTYPGAREQLKAIWGWRVCRKAAAEVVEPSPDSWTAPTDWHWDMGDPEKELALLRPFAKLLKIHRPSWTTRLLHPEPGYMEIEVSNSRGRVAQVLAVDSFDTLKIALFLQGDPDSEGERYVDTPAEAVDVVTGWSKS